MLRAFACICAALAAASPARAEVGVGVAVQGRPAVSVRYAPARDPGEAYHVLTHVGNDAALIQADYQRLLRPRAMNLGWLRGAVYAGLGLTGEAERDLTPGERWYLHLPVGVQGDIEAVHMAAFFEAAAKVGALPGTGLASAVSAGFRACF